MSPRDISLEDILPYIQAARVERRSLEPDLDLSQYPASLCGIPLPYRDQLDIQLRKMEKYLPDNCTLCTYLAERKIKNNICHYRVISRDQCVSMITTVVLEDMTEPPIDVRLLSLCNNLCSRCASGILTSRGILASLSRLMNTNAEQTGTNNTLEVPLIPPPTIISGYLDLNPDSE